MAPVETAADEVTRLRDSLNDLRGIMALPALWMGGEPPRIVNTALDALLGIANELERVAQRTRELATANERRDNEHNSRLLLDSIPGLVALLTAGGEVQFVNRQILEYTGQTLEELKQWGTNNTVHPEDLANVIEVFTQSIGSGNPYEIVQRLRRSDGAYRWFLNNGFPLRDATGHIVRWCVLLTDIDERKRAEDALRESERESRLIVDSIPGFVAAFTPGGEVEFVNRPILEYFGRTMEELKRWGTGSATHPEDLPRVVELFTHSIASGDPFEFEVRARRFDGVYRWFQSRGFPLRDPNGQIVRWYNLLIDIDERKRAEEALAASERNLKLIIDTIPALAWSARPDGSAEFFNQLYLDFIGLSAEQASGWGWTAAVHPDDLNDLAAAWQRIMASEEPGESEARLRRHDGEYRCFLFRANPLRDRSGNIVKWYGINTDIEDLKRAEDKARLIIDTALDAVVAMDAQGTITSWNKQAEAVFGWSYTEAVGQRMADMIIPAQQRMAHERGLRHFLATGEGPILRRRIEVTAVRRSGVEFPVELEVMPVRVGQEWVFSAFIRDITESRLAHDKLRESELNLRQMTETIPEMLWSATSEGAIDYCNTRFLKYTGFSEEEVMGDGWQKTIHPDDAARVAPVWMSCVATGAPYRVEVRTFHATDGTYRLCAVTALPLLDEHGRILKWHGTIVDMHDWKQAQEEIRNTQAALAHVTRVMTVGELTASIAHEVNQPLSGIITNANTCLRMLNANPPDVEGARETARRTIRDGNRAADVIARLRAMFSKNEFSLEPLDLNEATREVIALTSSELQRNRVIVQSELAQDLPRIVGDRVQLQQVILNLLRNASDAMVGVDDRPRQLLIRTEREEADRLRVTVRDAGVGIDRQSMDRLFDAFYTTKSDGMGIGLSVSRSIIERHHGRLWAEPNDGPGATFSFSIPRGAESVTDPALAGNTKV